jgi:hypothetical protein
MATSALPLEILRNGLTHCYYLSLPCRRCENVRAAVEEVPTDRFHLCPLCHKVHWHHWPRKDFTRTQLTYRKSQITPTATKRQNQSSALSCIRVTALSALFMGCERGRTGESRLPQEAMRINGPSVAESLFTPRVRMLPCPLDMRPWGRSGVRSGACDYITGQGASGAGLWL